MKSIFLAAGVPDPLQSPEFARTANVVLIREAVIALIEVVLPHGRLVFGGHPAITPFVSRVAAQLGHLDRVTAYQSQWFRGQQPPEVECFAQLCWTPRGADREDSLAIMREQMLTEGTLVAGVFIGGKEGVLAEEALFRRLAPQAVALPVASTGGAALEIWRQSSPQPEYLLTEIAYDLLFEDQILPLLLT